MREKTLKPAGQAECVVLIFLAAAMVFADGCAHRAPRGEDRPVVEEPKEESRGDGAVVRRPRGDHEEGLASWYGGKFHGRKTASGERFNKNAMTAAHRALPFGTKVKVTNLENGKSVVVRINDRGPWVNGRIIDLSEAAARKIDMISAGVVKVRVEVLK